MGRKGRGVGRRTALSRRADPPVLGTGGGRDAAVGGWAVRDRPSPREAKGGADGIATALLPRRASHVAPAGGVCNSLEWTVELSRAVRRRDRVSDPWPAAGAHTLHTSCR